jgi:hypothetical protein
MLELAGYDKLVKAHDQLVKREYQNLFCIVYQLIALDRKK